MRAADCKPFVGKTRRVFRQSQMHGAFAPCISLLQAPLQKTTAFAAPRLGRERFPPTNANFPLEIGPKVRYNSSAPAGVLELVDEVDSKSTAGDSVPVRVRSPAPYRVFITNLRVGCGHSISFCLFVPLRMYEQEVDPALFCYAGKAFGTYSTATPFRVSSR